MNNKFNNGEDSHLFTGDEIAIAELYNIESEEYRLEVAGPRCSKIATWDKVTKYKMVRHSSEWFENRRAAEREREKYEAEAEKWRTSTDIFDM